MINGRLFLTTIFLLFVATIPAAEGEDCLDLKVQEKRVLEWRKERDTFFKTHQRSPLSPREKRNFKGLNYRLELVATIAGINYINDTTSTTPIAGIKAINAFHQPILIAGGSTKNLDMKEFAKTIAKNVKAVALLNGSATKDLSNSIIQSNGKSLIIGIFDNLEKAIAAVSKISQKGDTVLFSPGCASFGMFKNEFDRGDQFNKLVFALND